MKGLWTKKYLRTGTYLPAIPLSASYRERKFEFEGTNNVHTNKKYTHGNSKKTRNGQSTKRRERKGSLFKGQKGSYPAAHFQPDALSIHKIKSATVLLYLLFLVRTAGSFPYSNPLYNSAVCVRMMLFAETLPSGLRERTTISKLQQRTTGTISSRLAYIFHHLSLAAVAAADLPCQAPPLLSVGISIFHPSPSRAIGCLEAPHIATVGFPAVP